MAHCITGNAEESIYQEVYLMIGIKSKGWWNIVFEEVTQTLLQEKLRIQLIVAITLKSNVRATSQLSSNELAP